MSSYPAINHLSSEVHLTKEDQPPKINLFHSAFRILHSAFGWPPLIPHSALCILHSNDACELARALPMNTCLIPEQCACSGRVVAECCVRSFHSGHSLNNSFHLVSSARRVRAK
jgi:hypothetical protein